MLLDLLGEGLTNKQIAARMFLAEKTVKNYVSRLLAKLGMERRTQAAVSSPSSTARTAQATRLENVTDERPLRDTLSQLRLRELLTEVQDRVEQIVKGRDRLDGLVEAMLVVTSGLELDATLRTIVKTAIELVDARYRSTRRAGRRSRTGRVRLRRHRRRHPRQDRAIARGSRVLGVLIDDPKPIRLRTS